MINILKKIYNYINIEIQKIKTHSKIEGIFHCNQISLAWYNRIGRNCHIHNIKMGKYSYIGNNCDICNTKIGSFTSIGSNLRIVYGNHPTSKFVSTHPLFYSSFQKFDLNNEENEKFDEYTYIDNESKWFVNIGSDVWIGDNVLILNGVSIGDGAIIAAGSVVTSNIPTYAVVGGVPAKIIKYRFDKNNIEQLIKIEWWKRSNQWIENHIKEFSNCDEFLNKNTIQKQ